MKTYYVQLQDVERRLEILADANPSLVEASTVSNTLYWQFKLGDKIVAQFTQATVLGWWTYQA